jgi:AraC-like DNA-binding protein
VLVWQTRTVVTASVLLDRDEVEVADVSCRHGRGRGRDGDEAQHHAVVFVRRGCFLRSVDGVEHLLDPTRAYCINPGQQHRYDHPHDRGDDCTAITLQPDALASLWGGDPTLPSEPMPSSPAVDLEHRLLLAAGRRGEDGHELCERAILLTAAALEQTDPRRVAAGRPATVRERRRIADAAHEALAADPDRSLLELAADLGVSAHHLSRIFRAAAGHTLARHRMRLRVRAALERLAGGERSLARLAADLGFADQSHLCRVVRSETGHTPAALRRALRHDPVRAADVRINRAGRCAGRIPPGRGC